MIIKNISKYFIINKLTYLIIIISMLMGSFHILVFITILLVTHEMGHFFTAKILGVRVDKIYIYPFGGISKLDIPVNYSLLKEFIILINGPLIQQITRIVLISFFTRYKTIIDSYHYGMLIFNLLPIYPLDGGKLLNILIQLVRQYKKSLEISIIISYICLLFLLLVNISGIKINIILIIFLLIYKIEIERKNINIKYEKLLLERYINKYKFKDSRIISNINNFYKNKRHLIKENNKYYLEEEYLSKKYKKY